MATSKEKDDMIAMLKDRIRELENQVPIAADKQFNFTEVAFTILKKGNDFVLIELEYDVEAGIAKKTKERVVGQLFPLALHAGKQHLGKAILPYQRYLLNQEKK